MSAEHMGSAAVIEMPEKKEPELLTINKVNDSQISVEKRFNTLSGTRRVI
jgi:hypothetical protein